MSPSPSRHSIPLLCLLALAPLGGCGDEATVVEPLIPEARILAGRNQADTVMSTLPQPFKVQVRDQHGNPLAGIRIRWELLTSALGRLSATSTVTGRDGTTEVSLTLGPYAGPHVVHATLVGERSEALVFEATAKPGQPVRLIRSKEGSEWGIASSLLEQPVAVRAVDSYGNPSPGATVEWLVTAGSGWVMPADPPPNGTDFEVRHRLGPEQGIQSVTAVATNLPDSPRQSFLVTAVGTVVHMVLPDYYDCLLDDDCEGRFLPSEVVVPAGSVVAWTSSSNPACDVTFEDNPKPPVSALILPRGGYHLRSFPEPGVYRYRCIAPSVAILSGMAGSVTVVPPNPGP